MTLHRGHPVVARGAHNNPAQWRRISVDFSLQWEDFIMHPVDPLILDESPERAGAIAVIDAPGLVTAALERSGDVRVWCDDLRDAQAVSEIDPGLLVSHPGELRGVDLVWGHLPKSLAALDEHCASVQGAPDVMFLSGARVKHMNRSMNQVLARHFTAVNASLGRSKCRVLRAWGPNQLETEWPKARRHPDLGLVLVAHGATFNGNRIDDGTRLLLDHLDPGEGTALDLGCGNGVIAAVLARRGLETTAIDVSWSAVAATRATAQANGLDIEVRWTDGLSGFPDHSFDVIATNPPFHRGHAKESAPTLRMFDEAARVLRPGGQLWCVFNSHLPWRRELATRIGRTRVVAQDRNYQLTFTNL
ncbi:class I SAM-dependent methyltransferase [Arachnia propionica]|uniref:class I SAM-dependent methyltransferase n=1 Tax=Arachnia propionica TaxID=1750 RepID=UPI0028D31F8D|nr:class I SAM-dependent methyltransferase [Arachnia propionica]